jgi:TPR repeat protein
MRALWAGAVLLTLVMPETAVADQASDLSDGLSAFSRHDYVTALRSLRPLADEGNAAAQFTLGFMYAHGRGVPQDHALAAKWYRLAADQGHALAQNNLGLMYANGRGVPKDTVLAYRWLNLAAAQGQADAAKNRDRVAKTMTPAQIADAQRLPPNEWDAE